ncbi:hypothetical protein [Komagataeibacter swingsii]|uniref:Uncharacterized protein n=1 Tax=Komagataeibacter swingsii TaxID=215220 RepID=A0A2V4RDT9_9PROT|nr:hypothetical protein [Komagataeibacter swingsii]PYD70250.1 hypothetical protein CFR76_04820 [Komagataeibacter swingsii]GBQ60259.1 hypothetical protein AA16373_1826 [Komagataeibacter swingsii DSM 16373]
MRLFMLTTTATLSLISIQAYAQSAPGWMSDIVSSPTVASWLGKKADTSAGTADSSSLTNATVGANSVSVAGNPSI